MCGIAGFAGTNNVSSSRSELVGMLDSIVHRGPDDEGFFVKRYWDWNRRLSIIDLNGGAQPIHNENKPCM